MSIKISLCMIVKNEEDNLANCLTSVQGLVDEINIIDTGSTDKTIEVASRFTNRIFNYVWNNDFSAARNFSFSKATKDYILWLDADDVITDENKKNFIKLKQTLDTTVDYIAMYYETEYNMYGTVTKVCLRERLVKRACNFKWKNIIHEVIDVSGKGVKADISISHKHKSKEEENNSTQRNLKLIEDLVKNGDESPRTLYYYSMMLNSSERYDEAIKCLNKFFSIGTDNLHHYVLCCICLHDIYVIKKDFKKALKVLMDNEEKLSNFSEFYCTLGAFYRCTVIDLSKACLYYKKALSCTGIINGSNIALSKLENYYYFTPYYSLGLCYYELGQYKQALKFYKKALPYNKDCTETKIKIAQLEAKIELEELKNKLLNINK